MMKMEVQKYDPAVRIEPLTHMPDGWDGKEIEPVLFVLKHPVALHADDGRTYWWPAGTVVMNVGEAEKEHQERNGGKHG